MNQLTITSYDIRLGARMHVRDTHISIFDFTYARFRTTTDVHMRALNLINEMDLNKNVRKGVFLKFAFTSDWVRIDAG